MAALTDAAMPVIDTSVVRVHQDGVCIAGNRAQHMGRLRGGLAAFRLWLLVDEFHGLIPKLIALAWMPCLGRSSVAANTPDHARRCVHLR
jgi:hypothetical protein